jgi:hypothetical protein
MICKETEARNDTAGKGRSNLTDQQKWTSLETAEYVQWKSSLEAGSLRQSQSEEVMGSG